MIDTSKMKKVVCCSVFLFILASGTFAFGQEQPKAERYFKLAPGISYTNVQDLGMSPMIYRGIQANLSLSIQKTKGASLQIWEIAGSYGAVKTTTKASSAIRLNGQINYTILWEVMDKRSERFDFRFGGSFLMQSPTNIHRSYSNNEYNVAFMSSIGPAGHVSMPLRLLNKQCTLHGTMHLPLIGLTLRPSYAYGGPEGFYDYEEGTEFRDFMESLRVQTIDRFIRMKTRIGLIYPLFNRNRLELGYQWDFFRIRTIPKNRVMSGTHTLYFMTQFNF